MLQDTVVRLKRQFVTHVRDSLRLVPAVKRKPKVLRHWLLRAHKAQIIIGMLVLLALFALIPLADLLASKIFVPVTGEALFGLIKTTHQNPHLREAELVARWVIWMVMAAIAIYFYLRHLPTSLEQARQIAGQKEALADRLVNSSPSESVLLYDEARAWLVDDQSESVINSKLEQLNSRIGQSGRGTAAAPGGTLAAADGTVLVSGSEAGAHAPAVADRYRIKRQLGSGAMGIVHVAEDLRLNRDVALKQLAPHLAEDENLLARFRQEALALARFSHPNIVQVYDFFEWRKLYFIAMELVEGNDLERRLKAEGALPVEEALELARQMADALGYAHEHGVVHRDFKPANVLMGREGKLKITDFGIAKIAQSALHTSAGTVMGSPAYMSPEQADGDDADNRSDIYALGVVLYQMLTGQLPFTGSAQEVIVQHLTKVPAALTDKRPEIPRELNALVLKMLAKHPEERYQSMAELLVQL